MIRRTIAWGLLIILLATWGYVDVRWRARTDEANPDVHKTDLTVYTMAGAAFFDGRDPYEVVNPRGWHNLYPPLFAIALAPLALLPSTEQALVWFALSCLCVWGSVVEGRRLWRWAWPTPLNRTTTWCILIGTTVALAFPVLNCLQRGQVSVVLTYFLLLGTRLVLTKSTRGGVLMGGIILALPVAIKLTPLLPAAVLCGGLLVGELIRRWAKATIVFDVGPRRGVLSCAGGVLGLVLWLFVVPSLATGWQANWRHLDTWVARVVLNEKVANDNDFNARSRRNQNLGNAVQRLGNFVAYQLDRGPFDELVDLLSNRDVVMPMETHLVKRLTQVVLAGLLLLLGWQTLRRAANPSPTGWLALFGLACMATLIVSPISWGHHYVIAWPALVFVPVHLAAQGRTRLACVFAISGGVLFLGHYSGLGITGRIGWLGIGTTLWFVAALQMVRPRRLSGVNVQPEQSELLRRCALIACVLLGGDSV